MKGFLYILSALGVMGLAFWAYQENYRTKESSRHASALRREIGMLNEALAVQKAEWAYLNRPERLRDLVLLNFERVPLLPLEPRQFGSAREVAWPLPPEAISRTLPDEDLSDAEVNP